MPKKKSSANGTRCVTTKANLPQGLCSSYLGSFTRSSPKETQVSRRRRVRHDFEAISTPALNRMLTAMPVLWPALGRNGPEVDDAAPIHASGIGREEEDRTVVWQVADDRRGRQHRSEGQLIRVEGDVAYELGVEQGEFKLGGHPVAIKHRVTNIYRREGRGWRMIHHHSDTSPAMLAVLAKL